MFKLLVLSKSKINVTHLNLVIEYKQITRKEVTIFIKRFDILKVLLYYYKRNQ